MQNGLILIIIVDFESTCCSFVGLVLINSDTSHLAVVKSQTLQMLQMCSFTLQTRCLAGSWT